MLLFKSKFICIVGNFNELKRKEMENVGKKDLFLSLEHTYPIYRDLYALVYCFSVSLGQLLKNGRICIPFIRNDIFSLWVPITKIM